MEVMRGALTRMDILNHPNELLDGLERIPMVMAGVFVVVGALCVINGYKWHKWVIIVLAFMFGIALGSALGVQMGKQHIVAIAFGALCAIVATPMMKFAVALFGGMTGAFIGANTWTAVNAAQAETNWAGAIMGFILLAMASFLFFKLVVILFTSIGGAAMVVFGLITLMLQVESWAPAVRASLSNELMIPLLVGIAAIGGIVLQQSQAKGGTAAAAGKPASG